MEKILYTRHPIITSHPNVAALMAILRNDRATNTWVCNLFNQLLYVKEKFFDTNNWGTFYDAQLPKGDPGPISIPLIKQNRICRDVLDVNIMQFTDFIINSINEGYYCYVFLDNYYLPPSKSCYKKYHMMHETFIYGYNDSEKSIFIADFYDGNKYDFYKVSFNDVNDAYKSSYQFSTQNREVILFKYDESYNPHALLVDVEKMKKSLEDFLYSRDNSGKFPSHCTLEIGNYLYGLDYFDCFCEDILREKDNTRTIFAHVICDYATIMNYKLDVLKTENIIFEKSKYERLKDKSDKLVYNSLKLRNKYLKYQISINIRNDKSILKTLVDDYMLLKEDFYNFILELICALRQVVIVDDFNTINKSKKMQGIKTSGQFSSICCMNELYPSPQCGKKVTLKKTYENNLLVTFDFIAIHDNFCAIFGLSDVDSKITHINDFPVKVRIMTGFPIDARDFDKFSNNASVSYALNKVYHFKLDIDLHKQTYDVNVREEGSDFICIAKNYKFSNHTMNPKNIGSFICMSYNKNDFIVKNLTINGESYEDDNNFALKIENGFMSRKFDFRSENILVEIDCRIINFDKQNIIKLLSDNDVVTELEINNNTIYLKDEIIKVLSLGEKMWTTIGIAIDCNLVSIVCNGICIKSCVPLDILKPVNEIIIISRGEIHIREIKVSE